MHDENDPKPHESPTGEVKMPNTNKPRVQPPPGFQGPGGGGPANYNYQPQQPGGPGQQPPRKRSPFAGLLIVCGLMFIFVTGGVLFSSLFGGGGGSFSTSSVGVSDRIGLVRIEGVIMPGQQHDFWMNSLQQMLDDPKIKGVVLRIDSPGGAVGTTQELYDKIQRLRANNKPVYATMGNVAASGGYYIAAGCDEIFSLKGTLTGSIGTIFQITKFKELSEKVGFEIENIKSGRFKDAGSPLRDMTEDEMHIFQLAIDDTYDQFIDDILVNRAPQLQTAAEALSEEEFAKYLFEIPAELDANSYLRQVADGRVYTGQQALQLGLIDKLGTTSDAISAMAGKLGIPGKLKPYEVPRKPSLMDLLSAKMQGLVSAHYPMMKYELTYP